METLSSLLSYGSELILETTETFSVHGTASPDFDPMGRVSSGAHRGARPRVEGRPPTCPGHLLPSHIPS
jgi:hypothetical protein